MFDTGVPTTPYDVLTTTTQFESETITFSTELVRFCLHLQQVPALNMHYAKTAPAAMEEGRAARKSQNPAGSNISVIQHVDSFPLRNQQKKYSTDCTEKSLSCLNYRFWNHLSLSDRACLPLQISASLPLERTFT